MKLLSPQEQKSLKASEIARDLARIDAVRTALSSVQVDLNNAEALFEKRLTEQKVIWATAEEVAHRRIAELQAEIRAHETDNIPIVMELKKAEDMTKLLQEKLDDVHDREIDVTLREQRVAVREQAHLEERERIKNFYQLTKQ